MDKKEYPQFKARDWSVSGLDLLPGPDLFEDEIRKVKSDLERFLHLVDGERREDFLKLYLSFLDQTETGVFRGNKDLMVEFGNRAFTFLSEYLDLLATKQVNRVRKKSHKEVIEVLSRTYVQFERAFRSLVRTLKIREVKKEDLEGVFLIKDYFPFLVSGDIWGLIKYQTCVFWNVHLNSPPEEFPQSGLYGKLKLFLGNKHIKLHLRRNKKEKFLNYTVFQGFKKCLPPLALPLVRETFRGLEKDLTQEAPDFDRQRIKRYIRQLTITGSPPELSYTYGSSFECTRSQGGQLAELLKYYQAAHPDDFFITPVFRGWSLDSQTGRLDSVYLEGPEFLDVEDWWWRRCKLMSSPFPFEGQVIPLGILEPLKVRPITKGDSMTLCGLDFIKRDLRQSLRSVPNGVFDLIFGSINDDSDPRFSQFYTASDYGARSIVDVRQGFHNFGWETPVYFNSGDFTAATNKCNGKMSLYIFEEFARLAGYDSEVITRGARSLLGSDIHYTNSKCLPYKDFGHEEVVEDSKIYHQNNGQLMGSVISFPILCMLNLFCFWESVERFLGAEINLRELVSQFPLRINGDDILFCGSKELIEKWNDTLPTYGFVKSLGKNLVLSDAFTINSVYFSYEDGNVQRNNYLNMGLLNGVKKGDGANDTVSRAFAADSRDFENTCYKEDFWRGAAEAYLEITSLSNTSLVSRAKAEFFLNYEPYLEEQGWTFLEWDLNFQKIFDLPAVPRKHLFFPHNSLDQASLFLLDRVYKLRQSQQTKRTPVKILNPGDLRIEPPSPLSKIIMERVLEQLMSNSL